MRVRLDLEIGALHFGRRRIVAAIEPDEQAGVLAEAQHLRAERGCGNGEVLGRPVLPVFPVIAAAPAEHDENSRSSARRKKSSVSSLPSRRMVLRFMSRTRSNLVAQAVLVGAQQHVLRPAGAANENGLAVDAEEAAAVGGQLGGDFANAEVDALFVGLVRPGRRS